MHCSLAFYLFSLSLSKTHTLNYETRESSVKLEDKSMKVTINANLFIQHDYKLCERSHNFNSKKVKVTQKLNAHHCKEKLKTFFQAFVMA
jgi:hypothetical protein